MFKDIKQIKQIQIKLTVHMKLDSLNSVNVMVFAMDKMLVREISIPIQDNRIFLLVANCLL